MPNKKSQGFKIKQIYVIVLPISSVYFDSAFTDVGDLVVWWFVASDGRKFMLVW